VIATQGTGPRVRGRLRLIAQGRAWRACGVCMAYERTLYRSRVACALYGCVCLSCVRLRVDGCTDGPLVICKQFDA